MSGPETERCRYCGAPSAPDAWYCLECGEPVRPPAEPATTPEGTRRATIAAVLALCLIGGGAGAYGLAHRDGKSAKPDTDTAAPDDRPPKLTDTTGTHATTVPSDETDTGSIVVTGVGATATAPDDWKGSGYTVILKSLPKAGHEPSEAVAFASKLTCGAGVLDSSSYPALTPGYWTVFCGKYATRTAATTAAASLRRSGHGDAYARKVA